MYCTSCGTKKSKLQKFCSKCGMKSEFQIEQNNKNQSANMLEDKKSPVCEVCLLSKPTNYIDLHQSIGIIVVRYYKHIDGKLCLDCSRYIFQRFTLNTLLLGWWSVISFLFTPFILINNTIRYLISYLKLKK